MKPWKAVLLVLSMVALVLVGCSKDDDDDIIIPNSPPAQSYDGEVAAQWFTLACDAVKESRMTPPVAARVFGYETVAFYEAMVSGSDQYVTLAGQLNGLNPLPQPQADAEYHWPTAASSAMAAIMRNFYAAGPASILTRIDALENQLREEYLANLPAGVYDRSRQYGRLVANAIFEWSLTDGYAQYNNCAFTPPVGPGLWEPTPPAFAGALQPCWGQLRTFVPLLSGDDCDPPNPPAYSTDPTSPFYIEAREVYDMTVGATPEQQATALYWADNVGTTATPPGHSISILNQLIRQHDLKLDRAAEAYARTGIAVADGFILCWKTKFEHNLLRPVTYIRANIDPNWMSPIPTPPFPEYTSGHSVQSAATAVVLTEMFGAISFTDSTHFAAGMAPRFYNNFEECASEAAISRLYGGIHYRAAIENGLEQGRCVGNRVNSLTFRAQS